MLDQSREGREFWRVVQMSTHEVVCEYFEHDKVRMHFARIAGENLVSPDEKATGIGVFVFVGFLEAYGIGVPIGGSGRLTDALIACIRDSGGEVLADVDVARVMTRNGRAIGVVTKAGQRVRGARSRDRRDPPARPGPHGRGDRCRRRPRCRGDADFPGRVHHRARRARRRRCVSARDSRCRP